MTEQKCYFFKASKYLQKFMDHNFKQLWTKNVVFDNGLKNIACFYNLV